jgi:hypothetical protein
MDIHKPKSVHSFGELVREIGVIVIGVVIALAGEQAVEALHWIHEANEADAALKLTFVREVDNAALRQVENGCIVRRLASLSAILAQASESGRLPPIEDIGRPLSTPWTIGEWEALVANQTVAHLPREKMIAYTAIHQRAAFLSALGDQEEQQWTILGSMAGGGRRLSDVEAEQLRITLAEASDSNLRALPNGIRLRDAIKATGLLDASDFAAAERRAANETEKSAICRSHL